MEDLPNDVDQIRKALLRALPFVRIENVSSRSEAELILATQPFDFAIVDLQIPKTTGGALSPLDAADGHGILERMSWLVPSLSGVVWSTHTYPPSIRAAGTTDWPYWNKALSLDWDYDVPQVPWREGVAQIAESLKLLETRAGPSRVPHATTHVLRISARLAPGILASLSKTIANRGMSRGDFSGSINEFHLLCEAVQIVMWAVFSAFRASIRKPVIFPGSAPVRSSNVVPTRDAIEAALGKTADSMTSSSDPLPPLLRAVVWKEGIPRNGGSLTTALRELREVRNRLIHDRIADQENYLVDNHDPAIRCMLRALEWIANNAMVHNLRHVGTQLLGERIAGTGWPWEKYETHSPMVSPSALMDREHVYQSWRDEAANIGFISLWPLSP